MGRAPRRIARRAGHPKKCCAFFGDPDHAWARRRRKRRLLCPPYDSMRAGRAVASTHDIMVAEMAHRRIRKFNTKQTYPEQNLDNDLAQAVVTQGGKIVWLRGQCAQNLDDAVSIDSHDPVQQTHKVMQNMRQLIEEAGGKMEHLVKIVVYITD